MIYQLSPAYDLLSTKIVLTDKLDPEELALTVNGKKRKLSRKDFLSFGVSIGIPEKVVLSTMSRFSNKLQKVDHMIDQSFLSENLSHEYKSILYKNAEKVL